MLNEYYNIDYNILSKRDTLPITLNLHLSDEKKDQNYLINIMISLLIYICTFFIFYFLKKKSIYFEWDNYKLLGIYLLSLIIAAILSKKFSYIKLYEYGLTLGKLFLSLLISLICLIILFKFIEIQQKIPTYILGAMFSGLVIETFYFIMLGKKEKNKISFFQYKNLSLKYFFLDLSLLTFFIISVLITNLSQNDFTETEFILTGIVYISWIISAATTHKFLPLVISESKWDAFELQIKFYLKILMLNILAMILLRSDYSSSVYFINALVGYSLVSSLISMFVFAPKLENKSDEATSKFLKNYDLEYPLISYAGKRIGFKYSFTGVEATESVDKQNLGFEYLKEYEEVFSVLDTMLNLTSFDTRKSLIIKSDKPNAISLQRPDSYQLLVNLHVLNDQNDINDYLRNIRNSLVEGGVFVGAFHPHLYRYNRFLNKYSFWAGNALYFFELIWKRVFSKLPFTRWIYYTFRKDKDQAISLAEGLGRLVYTGYKILDLAVVNDVVYFAATKDVNPQVEKREFYSPIFKMVRIGKGGKTIYVYKLRTMYPYSEFIQEFVFQKNNLQAGGKFKGDFRIPGWGKLFRKLFIDELPMLANWVKRDLKLVGVRPISNHYLSLYSKEHQERRRNFKPGLVPPFYADLPKTIKEIELSEKRYLDAYEKNPIKTDIKYLIKVVNNIVLKNKRSA